MRDSPFNHSVEMEVHHAHIQAGRVFSVSDVKTGVADNGTFDMLIRVASGYQAHCMLELTAGGAAIVQFYESPFVNAASLGTSLPARRRNRAKTNTVVSSMFKDPFINAASLGTRLFNEYLPGGSQGQTAGSGRPEVDEWILAPGLDYLYRVTNVSGGVAALSFLTQFYEIPESDLQ